MRETAPILILFLSDSFWWVQHYLVPKILVIIQIFCFLDVRQRSPICIINLFSRGCLSSLLSTFSTLETLHKSCKIITAGHWITRETSDKEPPLREYDSL